jgi:hypothetical protein
MDAVRLATPGEIEALGDGLDLTPNSSVITFGGKDFAVIRNCLEVDPMRFHPNSNIRRRLTFATNIETMLRFQGTHEIYFNVPVQDTAYLKVLDTWGANPTSREPEIRLKKVL